MVSKSQHCVVSLSHFFIFRFRSSLSVNVIELESALVIYERRMQRSPTTPPPLPSSTFHKNHVVGSERKLDEINSRRKLTTWQEFIIPYFHMDKERKWQQLQQHQQPRVVSPRIKLFIVLMRSKVVQQYHNHFSSYQYISWSKNYFGVHTMHVAVQTADFLKKIPTSI